MSSPTKAISGQLMRMVLMTSGAVLLLTAASLFAYEFATFRQTSRQEVDTLGKAIAANSTAALAFANRDDAEDVLRAFDADPHIVAAALYDRAGKLFAVYSRDRAAGDLPAQLPSAPLPYQFADAYLLVFQPVMEGERRMGTLFVKSDLRAIDARVRFYLTILALIVAASALLAYFISRPLQQRISRPILQLAKIASAVSTQRDYSVRAEPANVYELDQLTGAFNHMLQEIQHNEGRLRTQLGHLSLLQHITRAISDRQDLKSIFQVVLKSLEENLPIDFGCVCRHDAAAGALIIDSVSTAGPLTEALGLHEFASIPVATNGLSRCMEGLLVHETDSRALAFPLFERFATAGLRSIVIAPLRVESTIFGALIVARRPAEAFSSADCEFLKHLSEHVALAAQQAQLNGALQQAYDDLRQSQHTVMQQERLRALGQMASGIAHDINNAISPVALYTESLLEREPNLSERTRGYLTTIQRAIEDVAGTVSRMREFYRQREPQLSLARIDLNRTIEQAIELTHARWSDLPQQRGVMIELRTEAAPGAAEVMAAEGEVRDALTNLIFNAVDAMPEGGTLTIRTRIVDPVERDGTRRVFIEVSDTGIGMDEATRRRCLEPFFTTKGERGSGLGLAMVYGMVQRHSAELEVDSEPGSGSTFRLIFPASTQDAPALSYQASARQVTQRLRILVVDDDPMLIRSLEEILTADGHIVTVANGGQAGIDAFTLAVRSAEPFAIVITDLGMPHVDGRRVAAAVRAASASTPIIMLTGWGQRLVAENDIPPHVNRVLNKPPRLAELRAALFDLTAADGEPDARKAQQRASV